MSFIQNEQQKKPINYLALGDSYTICTGTNHEKEHWPNLLAAHLTQSGVPTTLVANPSRNGFSTQNLIDEELVILDRYKVDVVTLLVGVNDWVRKVDAATFHKNFNYIIDAIQNKITNKQHVILITIPDFGVTPQGKLYGSGRDISKGIEAFNAIIKSEAKKRQLVCVDLFPISKQMAGNPDLVAEDQLHPSAKEYAIWETLLFPEVKKALQK